jgi:zinc transporter
MKSDLLLQTYGADSSGMVCGFVFSSTRAGRPVDAEEVVEWLREHEANGESKQAGEFLWLHFNLAHSASERWIRSQLDLPETFFDALRENSHSTRIEHADGALRAVVNDVMFNLEFIPSEIATLWIYANQPIIVTARRCVLSTGCARRSAKGKYSSRRRHPVRRKSARLLGDGIAGGRLHGLAVWWAFRRRKER